MCKTILFDWPKHVHYNYGGIHRCVWVEDAEATPIPVSAPLIVEVQNGGHFAVAHSLLNPQRHSEELSWDSIGARLRLKWDSNGTQMGLKWDSVEVDWDLWDSNGTRMGLYWDSNGTQMGLKWDSKGTQLQLKWDSNGTQMGLNCFFLLFQCCIVSFHCLIRGLL